MMTFVCQHCGKEFAIKPHSRSSGKFCSLTCYHDHIAAVPVFAPCQQCGVTFSIKPGSRGKGRFCSLVCYDAHRAIPDRLGERICQQCGQPFQTYRQSSGKFCGLTCCLAYRKAHKEPPALRFWRQVQKTDTCWLWTGARSGAGYGQIGINDVRIFTHRFSWELHHGPIPAGLFVCHHCDNPPCVRPDHLFLGTPQDNMVDKIRKGRHLLKK